MWPFRPCVLPPYVDHAARGRSHVSGSCEPSTSENVARRVYRDGWRSRLECDGLSRVVSVRLERRALLRREQVIDLALGRRGSRILNVEHRVDDLLCFAGGRPSLYTEQPVDDVGGIVELGRGAVSRTGRHLCRA